MSSGTISIIADNIAFPAQDARISDDGTSVELGDDAQGTAYDIQHVHIGMDGEASTNGTGGNTVQCSHCNDTHSTPDDAEQADESDPHCTDAPECTACSGDGETGDGTECGACEGTGCGRHAWAPLPVSWCNSAGIHVERDEDSVTVHISVGDPRGNFAMTIRKRPDTGQLLLHVPYADMPAPHVTMREIHPGTFVLNE